MRKAAPFAFSVFLTISTTAAVQAQMPLPTAPPPSGAELFKRQCAACHTTSLSDPKRQGPPLFGIVGRKAGSFADFSYSAGFGQADWSWDETHLDSWLTNPQAMIPGAIMPYKQAKPAVRAAIIQYLKELH